jgi:hypothetical protein
MMEIPKREWQVQNAITCIMTPMRSDVLEENRGCNAVQASGKHVSSISPLLEHRSKPVKLWCMADLI